jgi:hypothetical protein
VDFSLDLTLITALVVIVYLKVSSDRATKTATQLLAYQQEQHTAAIMLLAETAIDTVKAVNLAEKETVRQSRDVGNIQINKMRDVIAKQAELISPSTKSVVRLEDGTEIKTEDYEWGI